MLIDRIIFVLATLFILRSSYFSNPIHPKPTWTAFFACLFMNIIFALFFQLLLTFGLFPAQKDMIATILTSKNSSLKLIDFAKKGIIPPLDTHFGISMETVQHLFHLSGNLGLIWIKLFSLVDIIFPIIYTIIHRVLLSIVYPKSDNNQGFDKLFRIIHCFPWLAMLADYMENLFIALIIFQYPHLASENIIMLANRWNIIKWIWQMLIISLELVGLIRLLLIKLKSKSKSN